MDRVTAWRRTLPALAVALIAFPYAWWLAGRAPFTTASDIAMAIPIVLLVVVAVWPRRPPPSRQPARLQVADVPAAILLAAACGLEIAALALGGRSPYVPSLSTVLDHLVTTQAGRVVTFEAWLLVGLSRAFARAGT